MTDDLKHPLRSQSWFGGKGLKGFVDRSWVRSRSVPGDHFDGRPIIGICNTWSELTPCNSHFRVLAEHVRMGILEAGGVPAEFPVTSPGETLTRPTAMFLRNLTSMDVEESIRANPIDGVVLLMGCDKTTPSLLMGAASVNVPTIGVSGGPMLNGSFRGRRLGIADMWKLADDFRKGEIGQDEMADLEAGLNRSNGSCNIMGTASTMAAMVEALGIGLPENAAIPASDARRNVLARMAGRRIVELVRQQVLMSHILTREAFENAIRVNAAIGGSTNAIIHLTAVARRIGVEMTIDDWDRLGSSVPTLVNIQPSGEHLMQDFHEAGGVPVVLRELGENGLLHKDAMTVTGQSIWDNNAQAKCWNRDVIRTFAEPLMRDSGLAVLRGNLCPDGAVIKPSAAQQDLLRHRGRAVVFENAEEMHRRLADPDLDVTADSVLVMKNCGPRGYPGMPELGNMPIPRKLLTQGVTDMVRISDARMSGTAFGAVVLHVSPEAAVGGTLALVEEGDWIELDVPARRLTLEVGDEELARRRSVWTSGGAKPERGFAKLYVEHVNQAHDGADFDFLVGCSGSEPPPDQH
ncbi:MAG: dihydroxy-acid dehydratase [Proteobacteria bacterium]|nr:dihydroxy-acid dehydratase [Pseudomonadota bacterium]